MSNVIKNPAGEVVSESAVISKYFRKEGQTSAEFMAELRQLDPASKTELALGAAKELGYSVTAAS